MDSPVVYMLLITAGIIFIMNVVATYIVLNTYFKVKERKLFQILFVWIVPFLGAMFAIYINREEQFEKKSKKQIGNQTSISNDQAIDHYLANNARPSDYSGND